jgi:hypothetical protein
MGSAENGANLSIFDSKSVIVRNVAFLDGDAEPGSVLVRLVRGGEALFENCLFKGNEGKLAQALFVYQAASARLRNCKVFENHGAAPAVTASWGGRIFLESSTIISKATAALRAVSTGSQAPTIEATKCILDGSPLLDIVRGGTPQPKVTIEHSAISTAPTGDGLTARDNIVGPLNLDSNLLPPAGSPIAQYGASR